MAHKVKFYYSVKSARAGREGKRVLCLTFYWIGDDKPSFFYETAGSYYYTTYTCDNIEDLQTKFDNAVDTINKYPVEMEEDKTILDYI